MWRGIEYWIISRSSIVIAPLDQHITALGSRVFIAWIRPGSPLRFGTAGDRGNSFTIAIHGRKL